MAFTVNRGSQKGQAQLLTLRIQIQRKQYNSDYRCRVLSGSKHISGESHRLLTQGIEPQWPQRCGLWFGASLAFLIEFLPILEELR